MTRVSVRVRALLFALLLAGFGVVFWQSHAYAQQSNGFSLQVTPSPLVATVKPGTTTTLELSIKNNGDQTETLKIEPRSFHIDTKSGQAQLDTSEPKEVQGWITFSQPTFKLRPGEVITEKIRLTVPEKSGFSYSFALLISRATPTAQAPGQQTLRGAVAVFTLINVDRPGAKSSMELVEFSTKHLYEYLPAEFTIKLKNTGNVIAQPFGNIFIQRSPDSTTPVDVLPLNPTKGYTLPDTTRTFLVTWQNGFGVRQPVDESTNKTRVVWDWKNASNFRFGKYTAKLVAVYNDGKRDVPIQSEVSFWVLPWKMLLIVFVVLLLLIIGVVTVIKKAGSVTKNVRGRSRTKSKPKSPDES